MIIDFSGSKYFPKEVKRRKDCCVWCRWGKFEYLNNPIKLKCLNPESNRYLKKTLNPARTTCKEWRYKF